MQEDAHPAAYPADALAAVTALVRDKGPAPWQPESPDALAAATHGGLGPVQAALLLAGNPPQLTDEVIAATGLKPRQKQLGDALLTPVGPRDRAALVGALLPQAPGDLWTTGPDTRAAGRVWAERLAGVVRLPEELAGELALDGLPTGAVEEVLNPRLTPWIHRTTVHTAGRGRQPRRGGPLGAARPVRPDASRGRPGRTRLLPAVRRTRCGPSCRRAWPRCAAVWPIRGC